MKPLSKLHAEAIEKAKTEQAKTKAAALAMIETPMDLIKAILLKHEEAVIEVMRELHQERTKSDALLRQALEALKSVDGTIADLAWDLSATPETGSPADLVRSAITAIRQHLEGKV